MVLVDTSVWIDVLRDKSQRRWETLLDVAGDEDNLALSRFVQLELLQGARDELEWAKLDAVLSTQSYLELPAGRYRHAARLYFEMRRQGCTVRSPIDCCIAQVALSHRVLLLHRDKDFTAIAQHCALSQRFVDWP